MLQPSISASDQARQKWVTAIAIVCEKETAMFNYKCRGTCSTSIDLEIQDGVITFCRINNGCKGNTAGLAKLVTGQPAEKIAAMLEGIDCRGGTSCPDQLSKAIRAYQE